jgi:hypothetical protein
MVVSAGTEEMVAVAAVDHGRIDHALYRAGEQLGACSFYLLTFLILMPSSSKNYQAKETVLVITVGFLVLDVVFKKPVFLDIALVIGLAGVLSFYLSEKIHWVWNKLSLVLGAVSNRVLLGIVFFLVVTPMALIRRMRGKDGLRRFDARATSNFSRREQVFEKKDLEKVW